MFVCTETLSGRIDYKRVTVLTSEGKLRLDVGGALLLTLCFPCTGSLPDPPAFPPGALCPRGSPVGSTPAGNWREDGSVSCRPDFPSVVLPEVGCVPRLVRRPGHTALLSRFWNSPLPLPSGLAGEGSPLHCLSPVHPVFMKLPQTTQCKSTLCFLLGSTRMHEFLQNIRKLSLESKVDGDIKWRMSLQ